MRLRGDCGTVLVEFSLVLPFMMAMSMGIIEFGYIYRSSIMVSESSSAVIRSLANYGPERAADYNAILSLTAGLGTLPDDAVPERLVIYDADALQADIDNCQNMSISAGDVNGIVGVCNVYSWGAIQTAVPANFDGADCNPADDWDWRFCPTDRSDNQSLGVTNLGVYVRVDQASVTGMFPFTSLELDEQRIMHVEPGDSG